VKPCAWAWRSMTNSTRSRRHSKAGEECSEDNSGIKFELG
jgi:hypothetical protein